MGEELGHLEATGILGKNPHADIAAPIIDFPKKYGKFRIYGDHKVTINPVLEIDQHPLLNPEKLFVTLARGTKFSLVLSQAYAQVMLKDTSAQYISINTHKGMYKYTCLPYSVESSRVIFQKMIESLLQGIPNVVCYFNDILVMG